MFALATLPVPIAIAVAVTQRRLYDVQLAVNRSLTYGLLSLLIAGLYAVVVGGVGAFTRSRGASWLPWVAAGVVAVSFAPLRNALQQAANRLTYGQWSQPADVLAATGRRLADAADVPALLQTLAAELGTGLGLASVEITDELGRTLARHGVAGPPTDELPLTAYGTPVGTLRWSGGRLRSHDRALLTDVAHQLGGVVHAAALLGVVRTAQERQVLAREEERKRLRRDLHDGLGPALAALSLQVDALRNRLDAPEVDTELVHLRSGIQGTVADVRRIVEGLRPPALDELGLAGALEQLADRLTAGTDLLVDVQVNGPAEPAAAVEVATYRIAQEALTNVVRHARARQACVRVRADDGGLVLEVTDDGAGTPTPRDGGVGLASMRERAEELGGRLEVAGRPGAGTRVTARLPVGATPYGGCPVIRLVVVDDHPLFRAGLEALLATVPDVEVVASVGDGAAAMRAVADEGPDVVLMDLNLPGTPGLEATRRIAATHPDTAVLVLTMVDDDDSVLAALRVGARGYVLKGAAQEEVLAAIRTVAAGGAVFGAGAAAAGAARWPVEVRARPHRTRGGGARPGGRRAEQSGDRPAARAESEDRAEPRLPRAHQDAGARPHSGCAAHARSLGT